ncbi:MAG: helix-turn-helix domain-containing protein [Desulfomonilaceae bacterium]
MSSSEIHVGEQIRAFRKKKKLSLTDLSKITGIAASNLSSIELGKSSPTLNTLVKIASAFQLRAGVFLDEVLYKKAVFCPRGGGDKFEALSPDVSIELLTCKASLNRLEARLFALKGLDRRIPSESEPTDRFVYCLRGAVTAEVDKEIYRLEGGDGLYLLPEARVSFANQTSGESSLLIVALKAGGSCA